MFTSRRNHLNKTRELIKDENPEALVFLYQLSYVSINNELIKKEYDKESVREITINGLINFWNKFKGKELSEHFTEDFERQVVHNGMASVLEENSRLRSYLEEKLEPSVRSNIWSKTWSIVSAIIVLLALIGLMLNECSR